MGATRRMKRARHGASVAALAIAALAGADGRAQTAPATTQPVNSTDRTGDAGAQGMPEIVVTAQFRQQNIQDTPLSITAINSAMLEARSQTKLSDITAAAPNVILQQNPAGGGNSIRAYIRGVGQGDQSPSVEPGVGIYVDDIYFATVTASIFDLLDLDRVEILRGPQGTLSGMNSEGGSIKLYSRKPEGHGGYLEATMGSYNRRDFKGSADFALVPGTLFARVSGVYRQRDGYVTRLDYACVHPDDPYVVSGAIKKMTSKANCKLGELGDQDLKAMRGSLRWAPSDRLEVNLIGDYTRDKSQTQASTLLEAAINPAQSAATLAYQGVPYDNRFVPYGQFRGDTVKNNPYITYANFYDPGVTYRAINTAGAPGAPNGPFIAQPAAQVDGWGVSGTVDYKLGSDLSLKSITGYRHYTSLAGEDNDGSPVAFIQEQSLFTHKQFSEEGRLNGKLFDNKVNFTVGGIYFYQKTFYFDQNDTPFAGFGTPTQPTFAFIQNDPTVLKQIAGFGNVSWEATDKLTFEGGVRVTHEKKTYTFYRLNFDGVGPYLPLSNPADPLNGRVGKYEGTIPDYRAVAQYHFTNDVMGYFQFSTGFKGGGISPRPYFPEQILGFGPEKLRSYELGIKSDWFDHRLRVNADVFKMDYLGYQASPNVCVDASGNALPLPYGTPGLCGQYLNVANADVKGFEVEVTAHPVDHLDLDGSVSYTDFRFGQPFIATGAVQAGQSAPGIGDLKWNFGGQYEIGLGRLGTLTPRVDVSHTPGYCGDLACTPVASVAGYTLVNARLTFRSEDRNWSVALEATNLTDKLYYLNKLVTAYASGQPGRPREFAVTLRKNF